MRLSEVEEGSVVEVTGLKCCVKTERMLLALSIRVGDVLRVIENHRRGPVLVLHLKHGHKVALGRGMASKIEVRKVENSSCGSA